MPSSVCCVTTERVSSSLSYLLLTCHTSRKRQTRYHSELLSNDLHIISARNAHTNAVGFGNDKKKNTDKVGNLQFHNEADLFSCARVHVFATAVDVVVLSRIVSIRHRKRQKKKNVCVFSLLSLGAISFHWHERYFPFFHSATCRVNLSKNYDNSARLLLRFFFSFFSFFRL